MTKTLYFNLEDDIKQITAKIKAEQGTDLVLVFPKQSYLFSDGVNLKLLKKQTDLLKKKVSILTMDERGQVYAKDAGFDLKFLPNQVRKGGLGDIRVPEPPKVHHKVVKKATPSPKVEAKPKIKVKKVKKLVEKVEPKAYAYPKVEIKDTIFPDISPATEMLRERISKRSYLKKTVIGGVALFLVVVVLLAVVVLPKATVTLYAKSDPIARDVEVSLDSSAEVSDVNKLIAPAILVNDEVTKTQKMTTLGKKELGSSAEGKVRVYNLSATPLNLKASTTTLKVGNEMFRFKEDQSYILPITTKDLSNPESGRLAVIEAVNPGGQYNLANGTRVEITNQVFGSRPEVLYAVTEGEVTGGNSRFISVITAEDIANAKLSLNDAILKDLREKYEPQGMSLLDGTYSSEIIEFITDKPEGEESPTFEASIKVKVAGILFSEPGLKNLLRERITQMLPSNKTLQSADLDTVSYKVKSANFETGQVTLIAHFESSALDVLSSLDVASGLTGKTREEAGEILLARPEISKVDITLSPSWQNSLPRFTSKIEIKQGY